MTYPLQHLVFRRLSAGLRRGTTALWCAVVLSAIAGCAQPEPVAAPTPVATAHGDFRHYTLALTWQPGFCATVPGCVAGQPRAPLIGLHGLWASRPQSLIRDHVPAPTWWAKGCALFDAPGTDETPVDPPVTAQTRDALDRVVPRLASSLTAHEYVKHARCFGFAPDTFFRTALSLRSRLADSAFGQWLQRQAGQDVAHDAVLSAFAADPHVRGATPLPAGALQLRCERDTAGRTILTQLWLTVSPTKLALFPNAEAALSPPEAQDNCPARFVIPNWPA
ncbi:ribonuclease I [Ameyamaea chiangmaiensis NBRC 103196]|uniref:Ribonuclease I n=1 Tax=Ameyamaea chiangmaiensis TaxID=442969 RepID=A0A850PEH8_9PROT|nr:ribonuclease I [Ameyamaea chiangmaiensis]MBS4075342.1 ribonuclease I [Ameyamaea chiangmaiensis]NVN40666.1 ribonuclease I [Ameyamaea chiangmaiensis]GBQ70117.1 ribonuclease I [Ameyamaea chiangmaiensis NBRC 103196]